MPKGYWIANITVTDPHAYADYQALAPEAFTRFGASILARGGERIAMEGRETPQRSVIIEFPSYQQALDCYHSEAYQEAKAARDGAAEVDIVIVEGL
ncbi:hypothetical protein L861_13705 [Litchfieldella anticariensis FP35 = DSM 16096]|uniref:DUF1330 domain-containing protein n=1 Tax=Litchfieldella anticariensis (strain DSM 16096 / CECT 5854 / CIP 108499 / LMG 22089 / FP35) TaxID=1121939 RepID=S2KG01_LITA3|nr:DUF1330 domain-containing protein [Halomonas anticariensis]EPC00840.1 hypothetical protein L861_13705 [Halomonas anticariensis FP35 = DSM 16096]